MTATGLRILLVDDDVSFSAEMAEYLSRYAYDVEQASELDQMMAALRGRDIILSVRNVGYCFTGFGIED